MEYIDCGSNDAGRALYSWVSTGPRAPSWPSRPWPVAARTSASLVGGWVWLDIAGVPRLWLEVLKGLWGCGEVLEVL